jgi:hypothetical protein
MRCYECGGKFKERRDPRFRVDDEAIGTVYVADISFMECETCASRLFAPAEAGKIDNARAEALDGILQSMPLKSFLSAAETAQRLGISRQALHKHRRISRGFIYHTEFGDARVYLRKSISLFLKSGDGRFTLRQPEPKPATYEENAQGSFIPFEAANEIGNGLSWNVSSFSKPICIGLVSQTEIEETSHV